MGWEAAFWFEGAGECGGASPAPAGVGENGGVRGGRRNDFVTKTVVKINKKSSAFAHAMRGIVERNKIGLEISTEG